jgi:hypothetical protein
MILESLLIFLFFLFITVILILYMSVKILATGMEFLHKWLESGDSQNQSPSPSAGSQSQASSADRQELLNDAEQFFDSAETFFRVLAEATDNDETVKRTEVRQTQAKPSREFQQSLEQVTSDVDKDTIDPYEPTEDTEIEDLLKDLEDEEELWK